ncbi:cobyrinate a,c-diamide synthase [uncultured Aliiroseovarius sp.]|nr:cobyrinate a,c-diamide synthase [uncultured Aliiroseovarius sp.]
MIAAAHKSSGKTVVSTGLAAAFTARGITTFKKGPDYIDPMWLSQASGRPCYNLDFNTMCGEDLLPFFTARAGDLTLVEANKGLYDGVAMDGADSNAALAKYLELPVILVIDCAGMTRGIAPLLLGYRTFDPWVNIAGVILNKVGGPRHEKKLREAVARYTDIPVVGAVHRNRRLEIGERHLGLTTPAESGELEAMISGFGEIVGGSVDIEALLKIADTAPDLPDPPAQKPAPDPDVTIAIARDRAFGFYYPDDLEAFAQAGAKLVPFDAMRDPVLPECDGLFIGGGFPEMFIEELSDNESLRADIADKIAAGMPTYAECGGLMYLCRSMTHNGTTAPMVGAIGADAIMERRPQGRGYTRFSNRAEHPWPECPEVRAAHEFHYARLDNLDPALGYARNITRGYGVDGKHDGILVHNTLAGFCHLRATGRRPWVPRFVDFVRRLKLTDWKK